MWVNLQIYWYIDERNGFNRRNDQSYQFQHVEFESDVSRSSDIAESDRFVDLGSIPSIEPAETTPSDDVKVVVEENNSKKDMLIVFGDFIISQLRRFEDDEILQIEAQTAIQRILIDSTSKYVAKKYENASELSSNVSGAFKNTTDPLPTENGDKQL